MRRLLCVGGEPSGIDGRGWAQPRSSDISLDARLSLFELMADLREAEAGARAGSSPGRGFFLLVRLFTVRACAPFAKSEHKAFREKAPSEEKNLRW